jgi:nucleotide-binding universal stress UspA family protein
VHPSRRRHRRVLVAIDSGSYVPKRKDALAAKLLETAAWFAEKHEGELHVMHAWVPYGERMMLGAGVTDAEARRFLLGQREEVREDLERALAPFRSRIAPAGVHLVKGDPRVVIADFATRHGIDLLVVGTVARSGVAGRIVGNTAEAVLRQLPCSMLVVKPDDWGGRKRRLARKSTPRSGKIANVR